LYQRKLIKLKRRSGENENISAKSRKRRIGVSSCTGGSSLAVSLYGWPSAIRLAASAWHMAAHRRETQTA
jgi:hypothetical protein